MPRSNRAKPAFLAAAKALVCKALRDGYGLADACRMINRDRRTVWDWRQSDEEFARAYEAALEEGTDRLEAEAIRRAMRGVPTGVYHQGKRIAVERKYSDLLLIFMLKSRRPDTYRDNSTVRVEGGLSLNADELAKRLEKAIEATTELRAKYEPAGLPSGASVAVVDELHPYLSEDDA